MEDVSAESEITISPDTGGNKPAGVVEGVDVYGTTYLFRVTDEGIIERTDGTATDKWQVDNFKGGAPNKASRLVSDIPGFDREVPDRIVALASPDLYGEEVIAAAKERLDIKRGPRTGAGLVELYGYQYSVSYEGRIIVRPIPKGVRDHPEWVKADRVREYNPKKEMVRFNKETNRVEEFVEFGPSSLEVFVAKQFNPLPDDIVAFADAKGWPKAVSQAKKRLGDRYEEILKAEPVVEATDPYQELFHGGVDRLRKLLEGGWSFDSPREVRFRFYVDPNSKSTRDKVERSLSDAYLYLTAGENKSNFGIAAAGGASFRYNDYDPYEGWGRLLMKVVTDKPAMVARYLLEKAGDCELEEFPTPESLIGAKLKDLVEPPDPHQERKWNTNYLPYRLGSDAVVIAAHTLPGWGDVDIKSVLGRELSEWQVIVIPGKDSLFADEDIGETYVHRWDQGVAGRQHIVDSIKNGTPVLLSLKTVYKDGRVSLVPFERLVESQDSEPVSSDGMRGGWTSGYVSTSNRIEPEWFEMDDKTSAFLRGRHGVSTPL